MLFSHWDRQEIAEIAVIAQGGGSVGANQHHKMTDQNSVIFIYFLLK
jgi:hypothetical protein